MKNIIHVILTKPPAKFSVNTHREPHVLIQILNVFCLTIDKHDLTNKLIYTSNNKNSWCEKQTAETCGMGSLVLRQHFGKIPEMSKQKNSNLLLTQYSYLFGKPQKRAKCVLPSLWLLSSFFLSVKETGQRRFYEPTIKWFLVYPPGRQAGPADMHACSHVCQQALHTTTGTSHTYCHR